VVGEKIRAPCSGRKPSPEEKKKNFSRGQGSRGEKGEKKSMKGKKGEAADFGERKALPLPSWWVGWKRKKARKSRTKVTKGLIRCGEFAVSGKESWVAGGRIDQVEKERRNFRIGEEKALLWEGTSLGGSVVMSS